MIAKGTLYGEIEKLHLRVGFDHQLLTMAAIVGIIFKKHFFFYPFPYFLLCQMSDDRLGK